MDWENEVEELNKRKKLAKKQGGKESVKLHHKKGRLNPDATKEAMDRFPFIERHVKLI